MVVKGTVIAYVVVAAANEGASVMLVFVNVSALREEVVSVARLIVIVYLVLEPSDA